MSLSGRPPAGGGRSATAAVVSAEAFRAEALRLGLATAAEVEALWERARPGTAPGSAEALAKVLVRAGRLTGYQASMILLGQGRRLTIGKYDVLDRLGDGGMGLVFRVRHRTLRRLAALKLLGREAARAGGAAARFRREAEATARVNHRNIVTLFDFDEHEGRGYLVMELVEGPDLKRLVAESGPLPIDRAIDLIAQAARGLRAAHAAGIVHRDIKPANLLLTPDGVLKIADLGLARLSLDAAEGPAEPGAGPTPDLTRSGIVLGTAHYVAPEQALHPRAVDGRADLYSLGCTLHELLTGRPPFAGQTVAQVLVAQCQVPPPDLRAARPDVPPALDSLYRRLLAKDPAGRPASCDEVLAALAACGTPPPPAGAPTPPAPPEAPGSSGSIDVLPALRLDEPTRLGSASSASRSGSSSGSIEAWAVAVPARLRRAWPWGWRSAVVAALLLAGLFGWLLVGASGSGPEGRSPAGRVVVPARRPR
jgi:serine/threonine-protein kinase